MKLNELKRLNNILYKYTGLGKIEKDVDASIIYHSCYYLDKILYEIYNYLIDYDVGNQAKFIEVEVKILDEDIKKMFEQALKGCSDQYEKIKAMNDEING